MQLDKEKDEALHAAKEWLPCPFCAGKDIRFTLDGSGWVAECKDCPCELRWFDTQEAALEGWNKRRTSRPAIAPVNFNAENRQGLDASAGMLMCTCNYDRRVGKRHSRSCPASNGIV